MADATAEVELMFNLEKAKASVKTFLEQVNKQAQVQYKELVSGIQQGVFGGLAKGIGALSGKGGDSGTKIFGQLVGQVALLGVVFGKALEILGGIWDQLVASSPALKSVANQFGIALNLFFKPFGDFLATLLRPMAQQLLIYAIWWNKNASIIGNAFKILAGLGEFFNPTGGGLIGKIVEAMVKDLPTQIPKLFDALTKFDLGKWINDTISTIITGTWDFGIWLGTVIGGFIQGVFDFGIWLGEQISAFISGVFNFGTWLGKQISDFVKGTFDFGAWLLKTIGDFFSGKFDFNDWLTKNISTFMTGVFDLGKWIGENISNFIQGAKNVGGGIVSTAKTTGGNIVKGFSEIVKDIGKSIFGQRVGADYIAQEGIYYLHRGETVNNATSGESMGNMNMVNNITVNATVSSSYDLDKLSRELAEKLNVELRRKVNYGRGFT